MLFRSATNGRWIALQPGARWRNKRWPAESFAVTASILAKRIPGARFVVLGGGNECDLAAAVADGLPDRALNLAGKTNLSETVEWLRACDVLVTNDTGPMHIAAALGKPVVALFGPTNERRTGPYGQLSSVIRAPMDCAPCMKESCNQPIYAACLKAIPPELAAERVIAALSYPQISSESAAVDARISTMATDLKPSRMGS